ncbi:alpha/beta hydrolase [Oceanobacillus salinisoli]|uniref:alpha/beta hydrolase n=1 Tax=Oceanobacillus salinisoli TaxID=2678611 RepID=UPI0012E25771|nr:dienelactone hydrolase family protein [Oceanobacillus salinisoli]
METSYIYEMRKPETEETGKLYPAIFLMHGMGSNEKDIMSLVSGLEKDAYIFGIRGSITQPPGFAYFTIEGFGKPHRSVYDETVQNLEAFIDNALSTYAIDQDKVFLGGFSQGAILSMTLGLTMGSKIKGIIVFSGYIPAFVVEEYSKKDVCDLHVFISHGQKDPVFPLAWGEANRDYFNRLGATVSYHAYPEGHTISLENYHDFRAWLDQQLLNK